MRPITMLSGNSFDDMRLRRLLSPGMAARRHGKPHHRLEHGGHPAGINALIHYGRVHGGVSSGLIFAGGKQSGRETSALPL